MKRIEQAYYWLFAISLVAVWSPAKIFSYVLPFVSLILIVAARPAHLYRAILLVFGFISWVVISATFASTIGMNFIVQNALLAFITYSSFYILLVLPSSSLGSKVYYQIARLTVIVLLIESIVGYAQIVHEFFVRHSLDLNAGDVVEGTIDLAFSNAAGFETKMFAMNIALSLVALLPFLLGGKRPVKGVFFGALLLGIFILASVVHLIIVFGIAIALAALLDFVSRRSFKFIWRSAFILLLGGFSLQYIMPINIALIRKHINSLPFNPKYTMMKRTIRSVKEYPQLLLFGLGPGQGISRAALIATGEFVRGFNVESIPLVRPTQTDFFAGVAQDLFVAYRASNSVLKPFSSWITMLSESGLLGSMLIIASTIRMLLNARYNSSSNLRFDIALFAWRSGLLFLFLSGGFELYWETPQAIWIGLLLLKSLHAVLSKKAAALPGEGHRKNMGPRR